MRLLNLIGRVCIAIIVAAFLIPIAALMLTIAFGVLGVALPFAPVMVIVAVVCGIVSWRKRKRKTA
jgi:glucose uptake protein GlcU